MISTDLTVVEHHLRRLRGEARAAFVADLWAARGFDTARDGTVVVATRGEESVVVFVPDRSWLGSPSLPDRPVDVVVAPRSGRWAGDAPEYGDARVIDATDLREMLWYAVDRERARRLCERHLGAPPDELHPPLPTRVRRRAAAVGSFTPSLSVVVTLLVLAGIVAGVGFGIASDSPGTGEPRAGNGGDGSAGEVNTPVDDTGDRSPEDGPFPPGVTRDGIEDPPALAAAHDTALRGRSYTIWIDRYRPRGGDPDGERVQRDIDIAVEGDRYLLETTLVDSAGRASAGTVYHDGSERYIADPTGENTTYRRLEATESTFAGPDPFVLRSILVARYLSTPETNLTGRVEEDGRVRYRIVGRGTPSSGAFDGARNYTVVALVDRNGLVRDLTVEFATATETGTVTVRIEVTYDRIDETTVDPPAWYDRRFGTDGTSEDTDTPGE